MPRSFVAFTILSLFLANAVVAAPTYGHSSSSNKAEAYTGAGGNAAGGNLYGVQDDDGDSLRGILRDVYCALRLNYNSGNAGNGGLTDTGAAILPRGGGAGGKVFTGAGGNASGGSKSGWDCGLVNLGSNNAGSGGSASSGPAGPLKHAVPVIPIL